MNRKRILYLSLIFAVLFIFTGCGQKTAASLPADGAEMMTSDNNGDGMESGETGLSNQTEPEQIAEESGDDAEIEEDNALNAGESAGETMTAQKDAVVIFFSRIGEQYSVGYIEKGNTAIVAEMIAEKTGADVFEIVPEEDNYPTDNYNALTDMALQEQKDNARPAIANEIENFDDYDTVFLGYPIWWNDLPMILYTFLENHDFSGKTVIPFCTHGGSRMAGTEAKIRNVITADSVLNGLAVAGTDAQNNTDSVQESVNNWLSGLGY